MRMLRDSVSFGRFICKFKKKPVKFDLPGTVLIPSKSDKQDFGGEIVD